MPLRNLRGERVVVSSGGLERVAFGAAPSISHPRSGESQSAFWAQFVGNSDIRTVGKAAATAGTLGLRCEALGRGSKPKARRASFRAAGKLGQTLPDLLRATD